jgi:hypothetical protein
MFLLYCGGIWSLVGAQGVEKLKICKYPLLLNLGNKSRLPGSLLQALLTVLFFYIILGSLFTV